MRILAIDDDLDIAEGLRLVLQSAGYEVDVALTAAQARESCRQHEYSVVFLDLNLPDASGIQLLPDLQQLCPGVDVLVLTSNTSLDVAAQAVNQGASFYLPKPVDVPYVLRILRRLAEEQQQRQNVAFQSLILENVRESVIAVDLEGRITYWNHGATTLFGWSREEMLRQSITRLLADDEQFMRDVPSDGAPLTMDTVRKRRNGTYVEVEQRVHLLRDMDDRHIGYLILSIDITKRREDERQLEKFARQEHQIALAFQNELLPVVPPERPGLKIAKRYAPAWNEAEVGGDFYDVLPLAESRTGLVLGDVSGKGLSAGVLMSLIRHVVDAYADEDDRPHSVLDRTNRHLARGDKIPEERFVTVFYATYNPVEEQLAYSSAGHEPAILRRTDGKVELLEATGPMIGLEWGMEFECSEVPFHPGDLLLIYTDGASEAGGPSNFLGTEGLVELVQQFAHLPVEDIVDRLQQAVLKQCNGNPQDDLALLCVRATS